MDVSQAPVLRLTGSLLTCGTDWTIPEFAGLFRTLPVDTTGNRGYRRFLRYYGDAAGTTAIRFFGTEVDGFTKIPEGMMGLEIHEDTLAVLRQDGTGHRDIRKSSLTWDWLVNGPQAKPVGEFTAEVPADWLSPGGMGPVRFFLTANAYYETGQELDDSVRLVDYDPAWTGKFNEMSARLRSMIPPGIGLRVEHYGSTAIPGMPAKPVIDILMEIPSFAEGRRNLIPVFNRPECEYWWYNDHMTFIIRDKPMGTRICHVHAAPRDHRVWEGIAFRDYLRSHPEDAGHYADLKYQLAERHAGDRETYTESKEAFVREITTKASELSGE